MSTHKIKSMAKKSFLGLKDPYNTVENIFPEIIEHVSNTEKYYYIGTKNVPEIPHELISHLQSNGNYLLHTLDSSATGGRAIDMQRINPISGRAMSGSSSGTAINVLLGINDLGIGTDGGGSVLAPAMSVNLFGFISKLISSKHLEEFQSQSTDNISFSPSIGYITRTYSDLKRAIETTLNLSDQNTSINEVGIIDDMSNKLEKQNQGYVSLDSPDKLGSRKPLIDFLEKELPNVNFLISQEGPVDYHGYGDSVLGHFDAATKEEQRKSNKGLLRVVNMAGATAITIPKSEFASAYLLISESTPHKIKMMLDFAEKLIVPQDELIKRYFRNFNNYFPESYRY